MGFFGVVDYIVSHIPLSLTNSGNSSGSSSGIESVIDNRILRQMTYCDMLWYLVFCHYAFAKKPKPDLLRTMFVFTQLVLLTQQYHYWSALHWFYKALIGSRVACVVVLQNLYHAYLRSESLHMANVYEQKKRRLVALGGAGRRCSI